MTLRKKTLLFGCTTITGLLAILYIASRLILMNSFDKLEEQSTRQNVARALNALASQREHLESIVTDYSAWDDTYLFVDGQDPTYLEDDLSDDAIYNLRLNLVIVRRCTGEVLFQNAYDLPNQQAAPLPKDLTPRLAESGLLDCSENPHQVLSDFLILDGTPTLVAAHPVVTSQYGGPVNGVMLFGISLDAAKIQSLSETVHLPLILSTPAAEGLPTGDEVHLRKLDDRTIAGFGLVKNLQGEPVFVLRLELPREIYQQGQNTLAYLLWSLLAVGLIFTLVILFPLENLLLRRLARLSTEVQCIGAASDHSLRLDEAGSDELSSLAVEINKTLEALEQSEKRLRAVERRNILSAIPDLLFVLNRQGTVVEVKSEQDHFLNIPVGEITGKNLRELAFSEESLELIHLKMEQAIATGEVQTFEKEFTLKETSYYEFRLVALPGDEILAIARDITERKRAEALLVEHNAGLQASAAALKASAEALQESEERYMLATRGANDGLWDWDLKTNQTYFSSRWKSILGYAEDEIGDNPDEWFSRLHAEDQEQTRLELSTHLRGLTPHFESEHRIRHKDGTYRWVLARGLTVREKTANAGRLDQTPSRNGSSAVQSWVSAPAAHEVGKPIRMAGSMTDITARKQAEEQLLYDAFHDALTGLPNRALFLDRLGQVIERTNRHSANPFAVLFLDLDRFKVINDSLGHSIGDQLLIAMAQRLKAVLRRVDTIARLGGDEFVILLEDLPDTNEATRVADRVQEDLKHSFTLDGHEVVITASIGIVTDIGNYQRPNEVLRDADIAMYRAKARGKNCYQIFDSSLRTRAIARLEMESDLRGAFENGELYLNYQPIQSLTTDRLTGFEALLRWKSLFRGSIPPSEFIPVAEETGLIVPIGDWVLREACRQVQKWQRDYPMDPPLTINVNISGVQFAQPRFLELVEQVLRETGLSPHSLRLEITESVFMENAEHANEILLKLRDLGVQLQIDDFGTGYSSLAYLQHFPIQTIKIDRSFISRMGSTSSGGDVGSGGEIVKTIVALARDLGMDAVAEGVETPEQLAQLKELECQYGQGYLIARPMDSQAAETLLAQTREGDRVKTN